MEKIPVSACLLTHNNGTTLARALESVKECAEILLCDGNSSDNTREIAKRYGAKILNQDMQYLGDGGHITDFSGVRNQLLQEAKNPSRIYRSSSPR